MLLAHNIRLQAGDKVLVDALNWQVQPGECWFVMGKNGVGKTSLLRVLAGIQLPHSGKVMLKDRALSEWKPLQMAQERAYLPQTRNDAFGYRVIETILAARHPYHTQHYWETDEDQAVAYSAMRQMDVLELAERDIRTLSGGERQRVAIAALLAQDTALLLLDEPMNALDLAHQASTVKLLAQLCREQKKAIVMVVHDLNLAYETASHALLLNGEGDWEAGLVSDTMLPQKLSHCLGHHIEMLMHHDRPVYISA